MPTMPRSLFEADQQVLEARKIIDTINMWIKPTTGSKDIIIFPNPTPEDDKITDPINKLKAQLFGRIMQIQGSLNSLNDVRQLHQGKNNKDNEVATALSLNLQRIQAATEKLKTIITNLKDELANLDKVLLYTVADLEKKASLNLNEFTRAVQGREDGKNNGKASDFVLNKLQVKLKTECDIYRLTRDNNTVDPLAREMAKKMLEKSLGVWLNIVDAEIRDRQERQTWNPTSSLTIDMVDVPESPQELKQQNEYDDDVSPPPPEPDQIAADNPVAQEDIATTMPGTENTPEEEEVNIRILFQQFEKARLGYYAGMRQQFSQESLNPFRDQMLESATVLLKYGEVSLKRVDENEVKYLAMYIHSKEEINTLGVTQLVDYPPYEAYGLTSLKNRIADPTFTDKQKVEFLFGKFMAAKDNYEVNKNKPALNEFNKRRIVSFAESLLAFGEAKLREVDTKKTDELALNIYDKKIEGTIEGKIDSKVVDVAGGRCNVYGLAGFKDKISDPTQSIMTRMNSAGMQSATVAVSVNDQEPKRSFLGDLKQKAGAKAAEIKGKVGLGKK